MKIFAQFVSSLICGVIFGFIGFTNGANFGGNYGFPRFGGGVGWESGGTFFMLVGIAVGSLIGITVVRKLFKEKVKFKIASIATIAVLLVEIIFFYGGMPNFTAPFVLLGPAVILTFSTNTF